MENSNRATSFDIGIFVGLAIGVAIGLLYAPQPGEKTRAMLREKALEIQDKVGRVAEKLK